MPPSRELARIVTRHHAALIVTAVILATLTVGILHDHKPPPETSWFELLLAALQVMETA